MADFSLISKFNPTANFKLLQIGSDAPVLEVELNEMQEIADNKMNLFMQGFIGEGLSSIHNIEYDNETKEFTMRDNIAFIGGRVIPISTLSLRLNAGEIAYLKVWEETVTYKDLIPYYGNVQETRYVENYLFDDRIAMETSRRVQTKYDLVKTNTESDCLYLPICTITENNTMKLLAKITHNYEVLDGGDFNSHSENTIDCGYF